MSRYWKRRPTWIEGPDNINSYPWITFSFNLLVIIWILCPRRKVCLKLDVQGQGSGIILVVDGHGGKGFWKLDNFHGRYLCIVSKLYICEKHFTANQIYVLVSYKSVGQGALPTLNIFCPSVNAIIIVLIGYREKRKIFTFTNISTTTIKCFTNSLKN